MSDYTWKSYPNIIVELSPDMYAHLKREHDEFVRRANQSMNEALYEAGLTRAERRTWAAKKGWVTRRLRAAMKTEAP